MSGPLLAIAMVLGALFFLGWWAFVMMREPSRLICYSSFLVWFLPLYYFGAWASGSEFGNATLILVFLAFIWGVQLAKWAIWDWQFDQILPEGAEEEVVNRRDKES